MSIHSIETRQAVEPPTLDRRNDAAQSYVAVRGRFEASLATYTRRWSDFQQQHSYFRERHRDFRLLLGAVRLAVLGDAPPASPPPPPGRPRRRPVRRVALAGRRNAPLISLVQGCPAPDNEASPAVDPALLPTALARAASDLHRGPAQELAAALMLLRLGARNAPADACTVLLESAAHVRRALDCLRETIVSLRNPGGRPGLAESLSAAVADARATGDIDVRLDIRDVPPVSEAVEDALTVVACEAVANAARHAGGSCITVSLGEHAGTIRLTVEDNGRGADPVAMMRRRAEGGQGVALMREQVHRVGGTYTIARKPEGGTAVTAVVPVRTVSATSGGTRRMPAATPAAAVH